jgi:hypothetical protein
MTAARCPEVHHTAHAGRHAGHACRRRSAGFLHLQESIALVAVHLEREAAAALRTRAQRARAHAPFSIRASRSTWLRPGSAPPGRRRDGGSGDPAHRMQRVADGLDHDLASLRRRSARPAILSPARPRPGLPSRLAAAAAPEQPPHARYGTGSPRRSAIPAPADFDAAAGRSGTDHASRGTTQRSERRTQKPAITASVM